MEAAEAERRSELTVALRLESERHEAVVAAAAEGRVVETVARLEKAAQEQRQSSQIEYTQAEQGLRAMAHQQFQQVAPQAEENVRKCEIKMDEHRKEAIAAGKRAEARAKYDEEMERQRRLLVEAEAKLKVEKGQSIMASHT